MKNTLKYKTFFGSIEYSKTDGLYYGKILYINELINYEGLTLKKLKQEFIIACEDYLQIKKEMRIK